MFFFDKTYPHSPKAGFNPFDVCVTQFYDPYYTKDSDSRADRALGEFLGIIAEFGWDLTGGAPTHILTPSEGAEESRLIYPYDASRICRGLIDRDDGPRAGRWSKNSAGFSQTQRDVFDAVICRAARKYLAPSMEMRVSRDELLPLWESDLLLDPRLPKAEALFQEHYEGLAERSFTQDADLEPSLTWMAAPDNAPRVASFFLFSRVAQAVAGETNLPVALDLTHDLGTVMAGGGGVQGAKDLLIEKECDYSNLVMSVPPIKRPTWMGFPVRPWPFDRKKCGAFTASLPRLIDDHRRLRDGTWAQERAQQVAARRAAKAAIPA